jgi:hypothetical protein
MKKIITVLTLLILLNACTEPKLDSKYVKIDFRYLSVNDFVEKVAEITGTEMIVDDEIEGKINFVGSNPILKSELIPLTNAILESHHLMLVLKGTDRYEVISVYPSECKLSNNILKNDLEKSIENLLDIKEKMYQYIFKEAGVNTYDYYFIGTKNKDEPQALLERFKGLTPMVLHNSMAKVSSLGSSRDNKTLVHHKENGKDGMILSIYCVSQEKENEVKIVWGYYVNGLWAGENIATLVFKNGEWEVVDDRELWIS